MPRHFLHRVVDAIRDVSAMLMRIQDRAQAYDAAVDPRELSDHLQRDLGLVDGRLLRDGDRRNPSSARPDSRCWADFVQTRHAA